jgi:Flp pilus assembly protein TadD
LLRKKFRVESKDADIWYNKGVILQQMERSEEALEAYNNALNLDKRNLRVLNNRSVILRKLKI